MSIPRALRISDAIWAIFQAKADRYTGGNISEWLRLAGVAYDPETAVPAKPKRKPKTLTEPCVHKLKGAVCVKCGKRWRR